LNSFTKLKKKIIKNNITIAVVGLGYVGLPLSLSFASKGIKVLGIDNDKLKINKLKKRETYISSVPERILRKVLNKSFFPSSNMKLIQKYDVIIICVPTPIKKNKEPIMKYIEDVLSQAKKYLSKNQIIILECTTYPGTTEKYFLPILKNKKFTIGKDIFLGYSPEREDPGNKKFSVLKGNLPKIVSGYTVKCRTLISLLYNKIINKVYKAENIQVAEFSKLLENIYRSVNIGLINELAYVARKLKIDINQTIDAAKTKPFGFQSFYPGPGVGGHCIPVDPFFLAWKAKKLGVNLRFIKLAGEINDLRPIRVFKSIKDQLNKLKLDTSKSKIVVYGISYKKDSDDTRESPALPILNELKKSKYNVKICDPMVNEDTIKTMKKYNFINKKKLFYQFNKSKDIAIIITNHSTFNYEKIKKNFKVVFDCRNSFKKNYKNIIQL